MFAVHKLLMFPLNVITAKRHYRPHGITIQIFPVPAVITVVTAVLPLSPLPCHTLLPTELKLMRSTLVFKRSLKTFLFQTAYCS